jgi:hypothetical protein
VASQAEFAYTFYILVGDGKCRPENRVFRRERHYAALPRHERIGVFVFCAGMAHAALLNFYKLDAGFLGLHSGKEYFGTEVARKYCK